MSRRDAVLYWAVYVTMPPDAPDMECIALFQDRDDAVAELVERLDDGAAVSIEPGTMTRQEWDEYEEVAGDFRPTKQPALRLVRRG